MARNETEGVGAYLRWLRSYGGQFLIDEKSKRQGKRRRRKVQGESSPREHGSEEKE